MAVTMKLQFSNVSTIAELFRIESTLKKTESTKDDLFYVLVPNLKFNDMINHKLNSRLAVTI